LSAGRVAKLRCFGRRTTIVGSPSNDRIRGTRDKDVVVSLGGDDVVSGLTDRDIACTGAGNDRVDERGGPDDGDFAAPRIDLGPGDDVIRVHSHGYEVGALRAGVGDDTVLLSSHSDVHVAPGAGDDVIRAVPVHARDFIITWLDMCVSFRRASGPVHVNLARGRATGQGRDRLVNVRCVIGSRFDDVLIGSNQDDGIDAGGGLNLVRAGAGNDEVDGGGRGDEVHLGPGADVGHGGGGWDRLYGGTGPDEIEGGLDGDYLDGGTGDDYLYSGYGCLNMWESQPWASIEMMTSSAPNEVFGRAGNDFLTGERGNDRLDGGAGFDAGTGGYHDGRIDWMTSLEHFDECNSPPHDSPLFDA
jgi:Ca2+-binding RTX toxin-like protein